MQVIAVLLAVVAVASCGVVSPISTLVRAPSYDSASIQSSRVGGNFAYSVAENHAYAQVAPVIQQVATPVAVSYSIPSAVSSSVLAPVQQYQYISPVQSQGVPVSQAGLIVSPYYAPYFVPQQAAAKPSEGQQQDAAPQQQAVVSQQALAYPYSSLQFNAVPSYHGGYPYVASYPYALGYPHTYAVPAAQQKQ